MPCVTFKTEGTQIQAEITFQSSPDVFNTAYLVDTCHRALIQTLNNIWPNWIDYDQYMARFRVEQETK